LGAPRRRKELSREAGAAIGHFDFQTRSLSKGDEILDVRQMFDDYQIPYGPRADVIINNRDYETSENGQRLSASGCENRGCIF
jgi:hypothetical protein